MKEWIPQEIKELRTKHGITQEAFANLLGVSRVYVGLLERADKTPSQTLKLLLTCVEKDLAHKGKRKRG
jgi:DNA-binding transcriptional regulator YiaG